MAETAVKKPVDFWLLIVVMLLMALGLIMVFSASIPYCNSTYDNIYFILKQQALFAIVGIAGMAVAANIDYRKYMKLTPYFFLFAVVLLIAVLIFGNNDINESTDVKRWFYIGPLHFQPSEIMKIAIIFYFSYSLSKRQKSLSAFWTGSMYYYMLLGIVAVLLLLEPHLSCTVIIMMVGLVIMFSAGTKIWHFLIFIIPGTAGLLYIALFTDYMRDRLVTFLDPFSYTTNESYQIVQSLYAIGSGGLFGRGIGKSMQKYLYLPEAPNDFIFSVVAEELGFIGCIFILALFFILILRGINIATHAPDRYGSLVAIGITSLIGIQSLLNVAVVTSSLPTTGVSLPFFSYGGTALVLFMCEIGVLLNISRYRTK